MSFKEDHSSTEPWHPGRNTTLAVVLHPMMNDKAKKKKKRKTVVTVPII